MIVRFIRLFLWLSSRLPLVASRRLGRFLGRMLWWFGGGARRVTEKNIALAFPELPVPERERLARQSLQATAELTVEMGFIWMRPWPVVRGYILEVRGDDAVREALATGRGVMVLGPHLGNWEVIGLHLATLGKAVALYEPPHMQAFDSLIRTARQRSGSTLVPTTARGLGRLVKALKQGGIAGILPDQVPPVVESGRNSEFMGLSCFTGTLSSKLLQRSGAVAFFGFAQRVDGGYHIHYLPAEPELYSEDLQLSLKALNEGVENCLRYCPEQYQWEYKRFRERPRGPIDYYAKPSS
ncbi:MAG: KDO2-lipid IV(A) lauroyltransferase [Halieaceae bacterium]